MRGLLTIILVWIAVGELRADIPAWLRDAAKAPLPERSTAAPSVVIVNDTHLEVDGQGIMTEVRRIALRVINNSGREHAVGVAYYNGASAKVLEARAWIVRDGAELENLGRSNWVDAASHSPGAAIDETRVSTIDLSARAVSGDTFGFETKVRTPLVVAQLYWSFGHRLPQLMERLSLRVPPGFDVTHRVYGLATPTFAKPDVQTWSWTMADQAYLPDESRAPESAWIKSEILMSITAPPSAAGALRCFSSWAEVAALYARLNAEQCDFDPAIAAKARELVAGETDPARIIARIGGYVQDIRYVGINRGLKYGYGWRARKASEVFSTGYGDCKDKANLMTAMLRECGFTAHRVIARLDRHRLVRAEFPSPIQFDHAIVAIEVPAALDLPAAMEVPGHGRLLFFDPTDPHTALGDLSLSLQGGFVHLATPEMNQLVQLPVLAPEVSFRTERHLEMKLAPDGTLLAQIRITGHGQAAAAMRRDSLESPTDQEKLELAASCLGGALRSASISQVQSAAPRERGRAVLTFSVLKAGYLQQHSAPAVLKLDVLNREMLPSLGAQPRSTPVELSPVSVVDDILVELPPGLSVEELPRNAEITSDFGSFRVDYIKEAGRLRVKRQLCLNRTLVAPTDYAQLRQFLITVSRADRSAVLLKRPP